MPLVVVGSVALDSVETPAHGCRENVLGGSAVFFSYAASFFAPVRLAGVIGEDWPPEHLEMLRRRKIDTAGLQVIAGGKTFRWSGRYLENMNDRETLSLSLNVMAQFDPVLPEHYRKCKFLFLANGATEMQMRVIDQCPGAELVVADTMDHWIVNDRENVLKMLQRIDGLVLNDSEARLLTGDHNLVRAGRDVLRLGPRFVIVKKGEHGATFFSQHETYVLPAFPTADVVDPTGAGDSFAGGMMGYLAEQGNFQPKTLKQAMAYGTVVASFCVRGLQPRPAAADRPRVDRPPNERVPADVDLLNEYDPHRTGDERTHSADGRSAGRALLRGSRVPARPREADPRAADDHLRAGAGQHLRRHPGGRRGGHGQPAVHDQHGQGAPACWLEDMVIRPEHRGTGIGTRLLTHAIAYAKSHGFTRITLLTDRTSDKSIHFYERHGFQRSDMVPMRLHLG